jgi:carbon starvation protein
MLVWYRALTSTTPLPTSEVPAVPSQLVAPAGLFATAEERRAMVKAGARS